MILDAIIKQEPIEAIKIASFDAIEIVSEINLDTDTACEHKMPNHIRKNRSFCEHDRQRSQCKDCKGGSICEHNKIRSRCKDCKGSSICEHDRIRSQCKDCKGKQARKWADF